MTSPENQLFTVEEALARLVLNKQQGCLIVSNGIELATLYVQNGLILHATSGARNGREAVEHALHLTNATHEWIKGIQPPGSESNIRCSIKEFVYTQEVLQGTKMTQTGKISTKPVNASNEPKYKYFLIPEDQPTTRLYLTRTATVLGRDKSSDLVLDDHNVSGRHCILDVQSRGLFILDLDSTNGTYVNGVFVRDGYVNPGDILELGEYRLTVNRELPK